MVKFLCVLVLGFIAMILLDAIFDYFFVKETPSERRERYYREYLLVNGEEDTNEARKDFEEVMKRI